MQLSGREHIFMIDIIIKKKPKMKKENLQNYIEKSPFGKKSRYNKYFNSNTLIQDKVTQRSIMNLLSFISL